MASELARPPARRGVDGRFVPALGTVRTAARPSAPGFPPLEEGLRFSWEAVETGLLAIMVVVVNLLILFPVTVVYAFIALFKDIHQHLFSVHVESAFQNGPCVHCGCHTWRVSEKQFTHDDEHRPSGRKRFGCRLHDCQKPRLKETS